jgi:hypothetical protein
LMVVFFLAFMLIETAPLLVSILWPFFDKESSCPTSMVVLEVQIFLGMVFQILLYRIDFGWFLMIVPRRFFLVIFVPNTTTSTMMIRTTVSLSSRPSYSICLPRNTGIGTLIMLVDYFRLPYVHVALTQNKIMGEPSLISVGLSSFFCGCFKKNIRYCHERKKSSKKSMICFS